MPFCVVRRSNERTALNVTKSKGAGIGTKALKLLGFHEALYRQVARRGL